MAKIIEEVITIKISQLVKDDAHNSSLVTEEVTMALAQVAEELIGSGAVVEIEQK